jgi:acyl-CoA dehydrogenase
MPDRTFLDWPFFDDGHRRLAAELEAWAARELVTAGHGDDLDAACRAIARSLGRSGWLRHVAPAAAGGQRERLDLRSLCLIRETLARHAPLADFVFALQGLGAGPITLFGSEAQRSAVLPGIVTGERIAAFAVRADGGYVLDGQKTWISNAGLADHYVVFTRFPEAGERGYAAFSVDASNPGLEVTERLGTLAPHPLGTIALRSCRVADTALIGEAGKGLRVALGTLDVFRATVGAAALGFARRALDEALSHVRARQAFGGTLADLQLVQASLADMAVAIDSSALLVYRAAWTHDQGAPRVTREAAMAKLHGTESAQRVIDAAVQLMGARGLAAGSVLESLYREIRALRIYEGASDIQRLIIAGTMLTP